MIWNDPLSTTKLGDNTFGNVGLSGRPRMPLWGARVVLVGYEPTNEVQN